MKKAIIITGVSGMIGSALLRRCLKKKTIVIGIDNFTLGKKKFIEEFLSNKNFLFFNHDLSKEKAPNKINIIVKKYNVSEIWMLAANSDINLGIKNPNIDLKNTFLTTFNTLNNFRTSINSKTKIIFSSSSAVYGEINKKINEKTTSLGARSNYGAMKQSAENYISYFSHALEANSYIFRFPNVVGKNLTHGVIYDLHKKLLKPSKFLNVLGNGEQQKPYSNVEEIIDCMMFVKNKKFNNKINFFNIGTSDKGMKVKDIANILLKQSGLKKIISYEKNIRGWAGDVPKYQYSTSKINKLGFVFKLSSKEAVQLAIKNLFK
jgi:UDP-glucose 4-epimerase